MRVFKLCQMKNVFIINNVLFFIVGNVLFSSIHFLDDHNHFDEHEIAECQECLIFENSSNYIPDFQEVSFLKNKIDLHIHECFSFTAFEQKSNRLSRAPPISK